MGLELLYNCSWGRGKYTKADESPMVKSEYICIIYWLY